MNSSRNRSLADCLDSLPEAPAYWVAYSGGVDSHVLLHLLSMRREPLVGTLTAVHVNHQIQQQSGDWEIHCRATCEELGIAFHALRVDGRARRGESPEAAARAARYRALAEQLPAGAVLLSAQHRDDQAETLLLQLLRGAGPRGLAAMPQQARLGNGWLARPLLSVGRQEILDYARRHRLRWVEDPSNTDVRYHRNLLRHRVMPELQQHWPGVAAVLARAADLQADQAQIADALAAMDCATCASIGRSCLSLSRLSALSAARQRNLLRYWVEHNALPLPSLAVLERIRDEMFTSRPGAVPLVHWPGAEVRRYRDDLYLMAPLPAHDPAVRVPVELSEALTLDIAAGVLSVRKCRGDGLQVPFAAHTEIVFRQGGECLQPADRGHRHTLKKLFQEWGVPEWERDRVPLIYVDGELAAVAGLCVAEGYRARNDQEGYVLHWNRTASPVNNRR